MKNKNMQSNKVWASAVQLMLLSFVLLLSQLTLAKDRIQYHVQNFDGSTLKVINEQGVVSQSYQYAPFGQQLQYKKPSNLKNPNAFVGGVQDTDDLVYLKQRHYNSVLGRFYQPDPVTFIMKGHGQTNRYQYGWNDTYTFSDPNGLNPDEYYKALDKDLQAYFRGQITFEAYSQNAQMYGLLIRKDSEPSLFSSENLLVMASVMFSRGLGSSAVALKQTQTTPTRTLYHYTDETSLKGIINTKQLNPSLKANNPRDAYYGDGQYLSDIAPGTKTCAQLSRCFINMPFQGNKFSNYLEIDVTGLNVTKGRDGVYVILNNKPLDISNRIVRTGKN
nr:HYD1 signature containing ADP-ribosyltransferase family protein [Acinetobacter bereziniae]